MPITTSLLAFAALGLRAAASFNMGVPVGTVNVPHTIHQGVEAEAEITIAHSLLSHGDNLVLQQSYTLNAFHFRNNSTYGNNQIAGIPSQFYKAELRYEHPSGFYAGANVQWNITKYPVDMANTLYANPYAIMGVRTGYKSAKGWAIFLEAANLMNKTYAAMVQPIADARTGGPPNVFNPGSGRAFYGGVSWAW